MKFFQPCLHFVIFLSLTATSVATPKYAKTGCNDMCGNVRIPFPFGIGANCSVNQWYTVECNSSIPRLSALNHLEILGVNLEDQIVTVNIPKIFNCQIPVWESGQTMSMDLGSSPFLFSKSHNIFVVEGCGNAVMMDAGSVLTGCSSSCLNDSTVSDKNICFGIACCQTTIPYYLKSYNMNLTRLERQGGDGDCGSAFLMDRNSSNEGRSSDSLTPVSLLWTLADDDYKQVTCCLEATRERLKVDTGNATTMVTWKCFNEEPLEGTSYLEDGCEATEECTRCEGYHGVCDYTRVYDVDGLAKEWIFTCIPIRGYRDGSGAIFITIVIVVCITSGLGLIAIIYTSYKLIKKTITKRRRKSVFKRINGGLLLKQQEEIDPSLVDKTILFTSRELARATDNFNENRILGKGGQGTVYKGMLADGRIVAIKKSKLVDESQLEQFINEVVVLSQVNHKNVVKLLGCCLETEVPVLVSEFIPNGTLYDHIHERQEFPFSLSMRLQIASEVAQALAYLHSATSIPIYHRDIKTTNILLDDKFRAKISDFGTSRFVSMDQTHLTTLVKGTFGYLDPEYFQSCKFTEKSDVYSFGVVIVELLTGEKPIFQTRLSEKVSLVAHFMLAMEKEQFLSIFDAMVINEGTKDELLALSNLAMRCLNSIGMNRPTMKEVATYLEIIQASHISSTV
ncbi:wall-associated receptor kinase-like 2 [Bidens hawaiensis]|uniref:wall-associated receptor kinase-like 2 n=1 Tax=Bidens hawaiensis TaxID=980011 RepID=UPI00404B74D3